MNERTNSIVRDRIWVIMSSFWWVSDLIFALRFLIFICIKHTHLQTQLHKNLNSSLIQTPFFKTYEGETTAISISGCSYFF